MYYFSDTIQKNMTLSCTFEMILIRPVQEGLSRPQSAAL